MLSFLMGNKDLQVIKITLTCDAISLGAKEGVGINIEHTVITPRTRKKLLDIGMIALLLSHHFEDELRNK